MSICYGCHYWGIDCSDPIDPGWPGVPDCFEPFRPEPLDYPGKEELEEEGCRGCGGPLTNMEGGDYCLECVGVLQEEHLPEPYPQ